MGRQRTQDHIAKMRARAVSLRLHSKMTNRDIAARIECSGSYVSKLLRGTEAEKTRSVSRAKIGVKKRVAEKERWPEPSWDVKLSTKMERFWFDANSKMCGDRWIETGRP